MHTTAPGTIFLTIQRARPRSVDLTARSGRERHRRVFLRHDAGGRGPVSNSASFALASVAGLVDGTLVGRWKQKRPTTNHAAWDSLAMAVPFAKTPTPRLAGDL